MNLLKINLFNIVENVKTSKDTVVYCKLLRYGNKFTTLFTFASK